MEKQPDHRKGHRQRLRERYLKSGVRALNEYEVIELLLSLGTPRKDVKIPAKELLKKFKSLRGVLDAEDDELKSIKGVGPNNIFGLKFIHDVASEYLKQKTTDAFQPYYDAVDIAFGDNVDYAQLHKHYLTNGERRYSPPTITGVFHRIMTGNPHIRGISTSYVERQNLTMHMQMRRFTRLTNAFSKSLINLKAACALHFANYNFCRIHQTLKCTPAMEAGITKRLWNLEDLLERELAY